MSLSIAAAVPAAGLVPIRAARDYRLVWLTAAIVAAVQVLWSAVFIIRSSVVVEGKRYFCLLDDAMISLRYAANWAAGHGLVWNPGERIEGYTNFLWTLVMGLCHHLGRPAEQMSLVIQLLGIPVLWAGLAATVALARACRLLPTPAACAVILCGLCYNLCFFTLAGMETGAAMALVTGGLAGCVLCIRRRRGALGPLLWFGPVLLMRPDVLPLLLWSYAVTLVSLRRGQLRLTAGLAIVAIMVAAHTLWRHDYYGEWAPNTYYLKAVGWPLSARIWPGLKHAFWTLLTFGAPLVLALAGQPWRRREWRFFLPLSCFFVALAYQTYVGGDVWPLSRFVLPTVGGLFVVSAYGAHRVLAALGVRDGPSAVQKRIGVAVAAVILMNAVNFPYVLHLKRPQTFGQARRQIRYVHAVDRIAKPEATVVVAFAGTFPYFSKRKCIDHWGKCEAHIARLPADPECSLAGHVKHDLGYLIERYKPDIILHVADTRIPAFASEYRPIVAHVDGTRAAMSVRIGSPHIIGGEEVSWQMMADVMNRARGLEARD